MPELPDVEIFKQYLDATSLHQQIDRVKVSSDDILKDISRRKLETALKNHRFESTRRHGKYLFVQPDSGSSLVLHFGMTGFLKYFKDPEKKPPHERVLIDFSNGYHLAYDCQRKLGEVGLIEDQEAFIAGGGLGPDALNPDFDLAALKKALSGTKAGVKSALMNQGLVAGIGNVYSDEILFQAGIYPKRKVNELDDEALERLFQATKDVLVKAVECRANPESFPSSFLIPHRREGAECPGCGGTVRALKVSGRKAYYCPDCQG